MSIDQHHNLSENMQPPALLQALVNRGLRGFLPKLAVGRLVLLLPNGSSITSGTSFSGPDVTIEVRSWRALWRLALGGEVAFARSFIDGEWSTGDLGRLFHLVMLNEAALSARTSPSWVTRAMHRLRHYGNRNTLQGSRRNILAHYDLGNSFYESWLDLGMNYSSALYRDRMMSLERAQAAKLDRVIDLLSPKPGERVLEIGCGWGNLAERLVGKHKCRLTAVTLSPAQLSYVRQRLADDIARGEADVKIQDYREITGRYDHIASIEMLEAVGESYWPTYFATLRNRLSEGGAIVLQAITICETRFEAYRSRPDFIQRYVFPGGMLPTVSHIHAHAERAGLEITEHESFGDSYALTLAEWRQRFHAAWPRLAAAGFDDRFRRLWDYYLAYCEAGFRFNATNVGFFKLRHRSG